MATLIPIFYVGCMTFPNQGILANKQLAKCLAQYWYYQTLHSPRLWREPTLIHLATTHTTSSQSTMKSLLIGQTPSTVDQTQMRLQQMNP